MDQIVKLAKSNQQLLAGAATSHPISSAPASTIDASGRRQYAGRESYSSKGQEAIGDTVGSGIKVNQGST